MTGPTDRARRQAGLTVIEMVIASAILLVVVTAAMVVLVAGQRVTGFTDRRGQTQDDVRLAIDRLTKDLRQTTGFTTTFPATGTAWSGHDLRFRTYTVANPDTPVLVHWWVAGSTLYREEFDPAGTSTGTVAMLQGIVAPAAGDPDLFTDVLDGTDAATGAGLPFKLTVTLTVQVTDPGHVISTQTQVQLRNLQPPQPPPS